MTDRLTKHDEPAHLADPADVTYTLNWFDVPPGSHDIIERFWVPVWSVPAGHVSRQSVLMYPGCVAVVYPTVAEFRGVHTGLSTVELVGDAWVVGVKLRPAAAYLATRTPVAQFTDRAVSLANALDADSDTVREVVAQVRSHMSPAPSDEKAQSQATAAFGTLFTGLTLDDDAHLANTIVDAVQDRRVDTVAELSDLACLSTRSLQRLCHTRLGLSPLWIIRRRRLQDAAGRLRQPGVLLADVAADLGYSDHAHFSRDFRTVTGMTPSEYAARWAPSSDCSTPGHDHR